jgi:hypothetical protein
VTNAPRAGGDGTAAGAFPSQGTWYNAHELTYGLTDRIQAAAYLNLALPSGHGFWWTGDKFRLRTASVPVSASPAAPTTSS